MVKKGRSRKEDYERKEEAKECKGGRLRRLKKEG